MESNIPSVIMLVINKIAVFAICFITSMITEWIGLHSILLPIKHIYNKIWEKFDKPKFYI